MKSVNFILIFITLLVFATLVYGRFLGGTISCYYLFGRARFTYRLAWEKGTGPCGSSCSPAVDRLSIPRIPASLSSLQWRCTFGCSIKNVGLHNISYYVTSVSYRNASQSGWEQGENFFFDRLKNFQVNKSYEITLDGLEWKVPANGHGKLVAYFDFGIRNDTGVPNASPIAAVPSFLGIPFGCKTVVNLPVEDPDADTLRCRYATPAECGDACTSLPNTTIDWERCAIEILATAENGYLSDTDYPVTVMVEDFPDYTISVGKEIRSIRRPISKVPLQFTIRTISSMKSCDSRLHTKMKGVFANHNDLFRFSYPGLTINGVKNLLKSAIYIQSSNINNTEFVVSIPGRMKQQILPDETNRTALPYRNDVKRVTFEMDPQTFFQDADTLMCVWGRQDDGLTTEKLCYTAVIYDGDDCNKTFCKNNGVCIDLYKRWTCKCPHGYKPKDCTHKVTCADFPCKNNGTCMDTGTMYICVCAAGFTGLDCEMELKTRTPIDKSKKSVVIPVVFGTIGGIALIGAASTSCCWWLLCGAAKRPNSREKKKIRPEDLNSTPLEEIMPDSSISENEPPGDI